MRKVLPPVGDDFYGSGELVHEALIDRCEVNLERASFFWSPKHRMGSVITAWPAAYLHTELRKEVRQYTYFTEAAQPSTREIAAFLRGFRASGILLILESAEGMEATLETRFATEFWRMPPVGGRPRCTNRVRDVSFLGILCDPNAKRGAEEGAPL